MTIEADPTSSTVFPDDLNATYPAGTDKKKEGDNHIRLVKKVFKNTFPNVDGAVTPTEEKLNLLTPGYFAWSGTIAQTGSLPLRLAVTDATASSGSCDIQFEIATGTASFGLYQEPTAAEKQFYTDAALRIQDSPSGENWYQAGLQVYSGSGYPALSLTAPGSGSILRHTGGTYPYLQVMDAAGSTYRSISVGPQCVLTGPPVSGTWYQANLVISATGSTPYLGMGGVTYGCSFRVSQSDGIMDVVNGDASAYAGFRSAGQISHGNDVNYGTITLVNTASAVSHAVYFTNTLGNSSYEFGNCDGSYHYHNIAVGGASTFVFRHDGYAYAPGWVDTSDQRCKENLKAIGGALDKVQKLQGYTFNFKGGKEPSAGILAQDLQKVLPESVFNIPAPPGSEDGKLGIGYTGVSALLVEAVKELTARLESAEARIAQLEKRGVR